MECEMKENKKITTYILLNGCKPKKLNIYIIHKWKEQNISQQQQKQGNAN